ncbi:MULTISPECIES: LysR family transcriptional regulator [Rhodanobacter]|uniref:Transcriptional regulator n=1 Tax=Rhodanobacter denitrificans TaxID=666685 RepID=I4WZB3_9GAMM|nr:MULTISPECIES: LysR family transcriptional regulator [Rhodanobacter]AGG87940.1 transcriptional regulator [Rhodanobacter denitrificans]EIM04805.1 LysR family transcriptional regulator [Rhodanobacter denitrificans]KZC21340.1 LysR family transcriptional regulator [Rhodanobacter denitrificans]UJJ51840.1 LysR substrate-binding domain-containing protein [Rhodanobacter denitrificans]UJJ59383.1 LysR substrate-binding domain-containing protein [Rhodanobacter denitrificans]
MNQSFDLTPARLRELRAFAAAARRLNFSRAALEVGCTPSVLSRRIATLEEAVGARLFLRTTRRMALTARGEQLLTQWQRMETVMAELAADLRPPDGELGGRLCVHLPASFGRYRMAPLLAAFMREHPGVRIDAVYDDTYVDMVSGRVDLAVRLGHLADVQLVARRAGTMRLYPCASPGYLASAPPLRDPADLKAHRCITFTGYRRGTLWSFSRQRQRRAVRIEPVLSCNDAQAIRDAILAGVGIGLQGNYMADALVAEGRMVELLPRWQLPAFPVHLLWLPGADRTPALRALIDHLATALTVQ